MGANMNFVVLNGSPKGPVSVTMQYVRFLEKRFPQHRFTVLHVCQESKRLEEDQDAFRAAIGAIAEADAVLWATPVYVFVVPAPYQRFIELLAERSAQSAFAGKYAAILTTSVRFFDHTALAYLHATSEDLGMHVAGEYSAEMYDLAKPKEQERLVTFWSAVVATAEKRAPVQRKFAPLKLSDVRYDPGAAQGRVATRGKKVFIVTDAEAGSNLERMVARLSGCFAEPVEVVNLHRIKMLGGCMGCIQCSMDNVCMYRETDDVYGVYQKLMAADIVVEAVTIRGRSLSARWKTFWDRGFFNNHIPILAGKQGGYLISGPLRQLPELREILQASAEVQQANPVGIVTDEDAQTGELDGLLEQFAARAVECAEQGYIHPSTFLGKAGHKIFRDEIWASLRFVFHRDHAYYKKHGLYDFPRRSLGQRLQETLIRTLLLLPGFRKEFRRRIRTEMIKPLEKVVDGD